mmetsp:Transcript_33269/g.93285  ORF Transcript_33269/g.93285 Transcript_33269/m.93285 type:complete len:214 (+) Transcript_33269:2151-2792(+)
MSRGTPRASALQPVGTWPATKRLNPRALGMESTAPLRKRTNHVPAPSWNTSAWSAPTSAWYCRASTSDGISRGAMSRSSATWCRNAFWNGSYPSNSSGSTTRIPACARMSSSYRAFTSTSSTGSPVRVSTHPMCVPPRPGSGPLWYLMRRVSHASSMTPSIENSPYDSISHRVRALPHGPTSPNPTTTTTDSKSTSPSKLGSPSRTSRDGISG